MGGTLTTTETFNQAFLAATPDIASEILDLSYKMPMWLADVWELKRWEANDNVMQQLVFRGSMPEVERGFDLRPRRHPKLPRTCPPGGTNDGGSRMILTLSGHPFEVTEPLYGKRHFGVPPGGAADRESAALAAALVGSKRVLECGPFPTGFEAQSAGTFAIVGAEYVLNMLPRGTHEYAKMIRPSELAAHCRSAGLDMRQTRGMEFNPLTQRYWLSGDTSVNYLFATQKPAAAA